MSILGLIILVLRRLPEAADLENARLEQPSVEEKLQGKGLPTVALSKIQGFVKFWGRRIWDFALEAKDLKPTDASGYRIKKLFSSKRQAAVRSAQPGTQQGGNEKTEEEILERIKKDPKNLKNYEELGKFYLDQGNLEDAKDIYTYLTKHEPRSAEYFSKLASCFYKLGEFSTAAEYFLKSTSLDSTEPNRYYNLGLALDKSGKPEDSVVAFKQAINLEPKNSKYFFALGNVYVKLNDKKSAIAAYREAKKLDPSNLQIFDKLKQLI